MKQSSSWNKGSADRALKQREWGSQVAETRAEWRGQQLFCQLQTLIPQHDLRKLLRVEWDRKGKTRTKDKGRLLEISDGRNAFACSQGTNGLWPWKQKSKDMGRSCGKPLIMALGRRDSLVQRQYQNWKYRCSQATGAASLPSYPVPKVPRVLSSPLLCGTVLPDLPQPCLAQECLCFSLPVDEWWYLQQPSGGLATQHLPLSRRRFGLSPTSHQCWVAARAEEGQVGGAKEKQNKPCWRKRSQSSGTNFCRILSLRGRPTTPGLLLLHASTSPPSDRTGKERQA